MRRNQQRPSSCFRRISSRIFRMDNLFCDTLFLLVLREPLARMEEDVATAGYPAPLLAHLQGDRHAPESVIGMSESVIAMRRNH